MSVLSHCHGTVVYDASLSLYLRDIGVLVDEVEYGASKVIQVTRCDAVAWVVIK